MNLYRTTFIMDFFYSLEKKDKQETFMTGIYFIFNFILYDSFTEYNNLQIKVVVSTKGLIFELSLNIY